MKSRIPLVLLVLACLALLVALLATRKKAKEVSLHQQDLILQHSNDWQAASIALAEVRTEKQELDKNLTQRNQEYADLSNSFATTSSSLTNTQNALSQTQRILDQTTAALTEAESKVAKLEGQNAVLDQQAADLNSSLAVLTKKIADTQRQLEVTQGDKALLEEELQKLMDEKAELERRLNDLDSLKQQIAKLKSDMAVSRRLDWMRRGLLGDMKKGGARQMQSARQSFNAEEPKKQEPKYDLNVEILEDGTVRVIPPLTNSPAATNSSNPER